MTAAAPAPPAGRHRPPLWRNVRVLRAAAQVAALLAVAGVLWFLFRNVRNNLEARGIETSFDFLDQPTGFAVAGSDFQPS
ncbi:MAG: hypothetical protein ACE5KX_05730, partial [Acidimicrobiia bacterium]